MQGLEVAVAVFLKAELTPLNRSRGLESQRQLVAGVKFARSGRKNAGGDGIKRSRKSKIDQFLENELSGDAVIVLGRRENYFWSHQVEALLNHEKSEAQKKSLVCDEK